MSSFLDTRLSSLKAYIPGEQPEPGQYIKLNTNEFPYPPAADVSAVVATAVNSMNLYSDLTCKELKANFTDVFGFGENNVVFTNGSDEALYLCFLAFCGKNKGVAFADITYGFYSVYADLCGIEKHIIPLADDFGITPETYYNLNKTIFIANPNAPTGKRLSCREVASILENNPDDIVVIDEAYADFSNNSCAKLLKDYNNLIIVGTFSKSRGMAGARLGYLIASEEIISDIEKVKFSINPYNVNSLTQAVGCAVLRSDEYYKERVKEICETREHFNNDLIRMGFEVIPSSANFVFAKHSTVSGLDIASQLKENGILIRRFDIERIKEYIRITIGTPEQMSAVIKTLSKIIGGKNENF